MRMRERRREIKNRKCFYCEENKEPYFSDTETVKKFVTERAKIVPRTRSGVCAKHQRRLSKAIKHARFLALLPYAGQQN